MIGRTSLRKRPAVVARLIPMVLFDTSAFDSIRRNQTHVPTGLAIAQELTEDQAQRVRDCRELRISSLLRFAEDDSLVR